MYQVRYLSHLIVGIYGGSPMKHKDKWQPIVLMILTTLIAMGGFYWVKSWNNTQLLPVVDVAGEETNATIGRNASLDFHW